jgi:hypothetical protein
MAEEEDKTFSLLPQANGLASLANDIADMRKLIIKYPKKNNTKQKTELLTKIEGIREGLSGGLLAGKKLKAIDTADKTKWYVPNPAISAGGKMFSTIAGSEKTIDRIILDINKNEVNTFFTNDDEINKLYTATKDTIYALEKKQFKFTADDNPTLGQALGKTKKLPKSKPVVTTPPEEEIEEQPVVTSPAVMGTTEEVEEPSASREPSASQSASQEAEPSASEEKAGEEKIALEIGEYTTDPKTLGINLDNVKAENADITNSTNAIINQIQEFIEDEKDPMSENATIEVFMQKADNDEDPRKTITDMLTGYFKNFTDGIIPQTNAIRRDIIEEDTFDGLDDNEKDDLLNTIRDQTSLIEFSDLDLLIKFNGLTLNDLDNINNGFIRDFINRIRNSRTVNELTTLLKQIVNPTAISLPKKTKSKISSEFVRRPLTGTAMSSGSLLTASPFGIQLPKGISLVPIEPEIPEDIDIPSNMKVEIDAENTPFKDVRLADLTLNQLRAYQELLSALPLAERLEALEYDQSEITGEDITNPFTSVNYYSNPERDRTNPLYNMTEQAERLYYRDAGKLYRSKSRLVKPKTKKHIPKDNDYLTFSQMPNISTYSGNKNYNETFATVNVVDQGFNELRREAMRDEKDDDEFTKLFLASLDRF